MCRILLYLVSCTMLLASCQDGHESEPITPPETLENSANINGKALIFASAEGTDTGTGYEVVLKSDDFEIIIHLAGKEYGTYRIADLSSSGRTKQEYTSYVTCASPRMMVAYEGTIEVKKQANYTEVNYDADFVSVDGSNETMSVENGKTKIKKWEPLSTGKCRLAHFKVNYENGEESFSATYEYNTSGRMSRFKTEFSEDRGDEVESTEAVFLYDGDQLSVVQYIQLYSYGNGLIDRQKWTVRCVYSNGLISRMERYENNTLRGVKQFFYDNNNRLVRQTYEKDDISDFYNDEFKYDKSGNIVESNRTTWVNGATQLETTKYAEFDQGVNPFSLTATAINQPFFNFDFYSIDGRMLSKNNCSRMLIPNEPVFSFKYSDYTGSNYPQIMTEYKGGEKDAVWKFDYIGCN